MTIPCIRNPGILKPEGSEHVSVALINSNYEVIDSLIAKNKLNGVVDPAVTNDLADGYSIGSIWINTADHTIFIAEDVTTGAAVWRQIYPVSTGSIDHGELTGLSDDDHTQYIKHALATAANDFLIASGAGVYVKKTLAETQTILGCRWSINEVPSGLVNGSNVTFTLAYTPAGSQIMLYLNGQYMTVGVGEDYTISGSTITMTEAPIVGDKIRINYPY
ncbi:MAG: hypothetical protein WC455_27005 [Dehalococcoidia bacterium]|jgi:hypothetical protein